MLSFCKEILKIAEKVFQNDQMQLLPVMNMLIDLEIGNREVPVKSLEKVIQIYKDSNPERPAFDPILAEYQLNYSQ